jgi:hypothetical protein
LWTSAALGFPDKENPALNAPRIVNRFFRTGTGISPVLGDVSGQAPAE